MALKGETIQSLGDAADRICGAVHEGNADGCKRNDDAAALLAWLGAANALCAADVADLASLLRFARHLDRLFEIPVPDAPGLHCFGAEVASASFGAIVDDRASVSGVGGDRLSAFRACVAEAVEFVCQFETEGDERAFADTGATLSADLMPLLGDRPDDVMGAHGRRWVETGNPASGERDLIPSVLCFRQSKGRRPNGLPYAMGLGVGAGRSREEAAVHAILEWVERDAVALWWRGGCEPSAIAAETLAASGVVERLRRYRQGVSGRNTWFLDLTSDLGIPVVAALSVDDGNAGFAYGFSAATTVESALPKALEELLQIELADNLVAAKCKEGGEARLNETDRGHLARAGAVSPDWLGLQPLAMAKRKDARAISPGIDDAPACLRALAARLKEHGHRVRLVDLTREDIGVAVMRAVIPGLQPDPADLVTRRLAERRRSSRMSRIPGDEVALY